MVPSGPAVQARGVLLDRPVAAGVRRSGRRLEGRITNMTATKELERAIGLDTSVVDVDTVVKVIEVIGTSDRSFDDAIATAIKTASRTLRHMTGADVKHMTVGIREGKIVQYKVDLKLAFALEPEHEELDD
jgi:hypothetical protein